MQERVKEVERGRSPRPSLYAVSGRALYILVRRASAISRQLGGRGERGRARRRGLGKEVAGRRPRSRCCVENNGSGRTSPKTGAERSGVAAQNEPKPGTARGWASDVRDRGSARPRHLDRAPPAQQGPTVSSARLDESRRPRPLNCPAGRWSRQQVRSCRPRALAQLSAARKLQRDLLA